MTNRQERDDAFNGCPRILPLLLPTTCRVLCSTIVNQRVDLFAALCATMPKLIAIVAGVGAGTGAAIARRFAKSYPVVLLARNSDSYADLVTEINGAGGNKAIGISADISDAQSVKHALEEIKKEFGDHAQAAAAIFQCLWPIHQEALLGAHRGRIRSVLQRFSVRQWPLCSFAFSGMTRF